MALPSPVFLSHTTLRGRVAFTLISDVGADLRAMMQEELNNQLVHLESKILQHALKNTDEVLLEFESEQHVFPLSAVRHWCEHFRFEQVGWTLDPLHDDSRAQARLWLIRADGAQSVTSCALPQGQRPV